MSPRLIVFAIGMVLLTVSASPVYAQSGSGMSDDGMATTPPPVEGDAGGVGVDASVPPVNVMPVAGAGRAALEIRVGQLESQLRTLTGKIEVLQHQLQVAQDQKPATASASSDDLARLEARINALEQKQASAPVAEPADAGVASVSAGDLVQPDKAGGVAYASSAKNQTLGTLSQSGTTGATAAAPNSPDAAYAQAYGKYKAGQYDAARTALQAFLTKYPKHPLAGNAQYWLGETWYAQGKYDQSAKAFARGYQTYPQSPKAPDALLKLGMSFAAQGKKPEACLTYTQLKQQFPVVSQTMGALPGERAKADCK